MDPRCHLSGKESTISGDQHPLHKNRRRHEDIIRATGSYLRLCIS